MTIAETGPAVTPDPAQPPIGERIEYLVFVAQERRYAVPLTSVREIRAWSDPTPLPHAAAHIMGVVNLRGTVMPVADLGHRMSGRPTKTGPRHVFVIAETSEGPFGFLVDAVADIFAANAGAELDVPDVGEDQAMIAALLEDDAGMIQVLDLAAVVASAPRAERSA